jgi:hypothetical protein
MNMQSEGSFCMDNKFLKAMQGVGSETTENGMPTNSSSMSSVMDLFFKMGGSRQNSDEELISWFSRAFGENPELAVKCIFYNRDIRGGQGERRSFRIFYKFLLENHPEVALKFMQFIPEYGRWDDLLHIFMDTPQENVMAFFILSALKLNNKLCAKWMPRENKAHSDWAVKLMSYWDLIPAKYRKLLSGNTSVVENLMCKNQWDKVVYNSVPSIAMKNYKHAFSRHDGTRFGLWLEDLEKPESGAKIHADAIFPHDIVKSLLYESVNDSSRKALEAQWKALPDYMPKGKKIIPICDVSGSMMGEPLLVSISLGIYLSQRNVGPFQNAVITFSERPQLQVLTGPTLYDRVMQLNRTPWQMNTNLEAVFRLILDQAVRYKLSPEDLPDSLVIISDMQFDECINEPDNSAMEMIRRMYQTAGYKIPNVYFWNVRTSKGVPAQFDEGGTALISGFSPSIMKNFLEGEIDPLKIMMKTLMDDRYKLIVL